MLVLGMLLAGVTGCRAARIEWDRSRKWERLRERQERWYRMAWGTPIERSAVEEGRRRFDCVWDALTRVRVDPRADVECTIRQLDVLIACGPTESRVEVCFERSRRVCLLSAEYRSAATECRGPGVPR